MTNNQWKKKEKTISINKAFYFNIVLVKKLKKKETFSFRWFVYVCLFFLVLLVCQEEKRQIIRISISSFV